jgi:ketosteroid isomerase-like protein
MHFVASMLFAVLVVPAETPSEVEPFLDSFVAAFNDLDWEKFRAHFSEDATVFFPAPYPPARASGRDAVEAGFHGVFERWRRERSGPPYLDIRPRDVVLQSFGDVTVATFHLDDVERPSRRTLVLRRETTGLKIVHLHASTQ